MRKKLTKENLLLKKQEGENKILLLQQQIDVLEDEKEVLKYKVEGIQAKADSL